MLWKSASRRTLGGFPQTQKSKIKHESKKAQHLFFYHFIYYFIIIYYYQWYCLIFEPIAVGFF